MKPDEERVNFLYDYSSTSQFNHEFNDRKYKSAFSFNQPGFEYMCDSPTPEDCNKESLFSKTTRLVISSLCLVLLICTFPISFPLCIRKVPALERLVVFRMGKIEKVKGPGFVLIMPCIDHWLKVDLHAQKFRTETQQLLTRDGAILEIGALVHYQIVDVVRSVMQVDRLEIVFKRLVQQCLNTAVTQRDEEDVTRKTHMLQRDLQNMLNKSTVAWGLEVTQVDIPPVQILKASEQKNPVSTLMTALNTAVGGNTQTQTSALPPSIHTQVITSVEACEESIEDIDQAFSRLNLMLQEVMQQGMFQGQDGVIKLAVSDVNRNYYLVIRNGSGDFYEDLVGTGPHSEDVTLTLTSEVLLELLGKRMSPINAYSKGLVSVEGDWTLLKHFTKIFGQQV